MFLNTKYANFRLASLVVWTSRVEEHELLRTERRKSSNSANSSVLDNISQVASATAIVLTVFTEEIYQIPGLKTQGLE